MDYLSASLSFGIVRRRIQALVVEASMDLGLTYAEFSMLLILFDREGCSQDDMTAYLHVDKAAITRVIKKLEERGYIYRQQDTTDRRLKRLYLTDEGRKIEKRIKDIVRRILNYLSEGYSQKETDLIIKCLHDMAQRLGKADAQEVFGERRKR
ncbi:MarR family transcriptional regulator [Anaerovibrio sp.]|uniref:MarR family transcriptional regulator n=1 Tax=Anaerovibrio sp. TaxID=1872532 RepID=UPI0025BB9112|nr:MarR family transcriptional regulator [Anaerovibrio sp.]MBR2142508.1 MarR family transcriptional regulator [Anaerovibrio sp.]